MYTYFMQFLNPSVLHLDSVVCLVSGSDLNKKLEI